LFFGPKNSLKVLKCNLLTTTFLQQEPYILVSWWSRHATSVGQRISMKLVVNEEGSQIDVFITIKIWFRKFCSIIWDKSFLHCSIQLCKYRISKGLCCLMISCIVFTKNIIMDKKYRKYLLTSKQLINYDKNTFVNLFRTCILNAWRILNCMIQFLPFHFQIANCMLMSKNSSGMLHAPIL